jgi:hypothetical protein
MIPKDARLLNLRENSKVPASSHGHHDALPQDKFVQTGNNVGIALDGQYLLVDIDDWSNRAAVDLAEEILSLNPPPWGQKTPHGNHYLFSVPPGWKGTNVTLKDDSDKPFGDLKSLGYLVAPGSIVNGCTYEVIDAVEPPPAPQWLLDKATRPPAQEKGKVEERAGIPYGEHDAFLVRMAGWLRGTEGLSASSIKAALEMGPLALLEGTDETRPYTDKDFERIARSAVRWQAKRVESLDLVHPSLQLASDIELVGEPIRWIVRGFVPQGELVLMYGPGGIGKSSFASWLNAEVNRLGLTFAYCGTEEPPARFFGRSVLAGAKRGMSYNVKNPGAIKFPRDADLIRELILESKVNVLYMDSIYSHFEHQEGQNAAEKARAALAPLLEIAHETGCTIFGVFHTNKAGAFLGSTEMENVARCLLEAKRAPKETCLKVRVHKTNLYNPNKAMRLEGRDEIFRDEQGNVQMEIDETGAAIPLMIVVPTRIADVDDEPEAPMEFDQDDLTDPEASTKERVQAYLEENPNTTNQRIADDLGITVSNAKKIAWELRKTNPELFVL